MGSEKTPGLVSSGLRAQKGAGSHRKSRGLEGPSKGRALGRKLLGQPRGDRGGGGVCSTKPCSEVQGRERAEVDQGTPPNPRQGLQFRAMRK